MKIAITLTFILLAICQTSSLILPSNYGNSSKQIVGGEKTIPNRYPYMVGLARSTDFEFYCGGTLIAPEWVLSAAHCSSQKGNITVLIGHYNLSDPDEIHEVIKVTEQIVHPKYNIDVEDDYDLMLLKLKTPSNYSFVRLNDGFLDLDFRTDLTVMGWGVESFDNETLSEVLMEVEVDYVPQILCKILYFFSGYSDSMLCAYREGKGSCRGDSGGPIIMKGDDESSDVQVGIVSWGIGCAFLFFPGVYSRVSSGIDFIREYVPSI